NIDSSLFYFQEGRRLMDKMSQLSVAKSWKYFSYLSTQLQLAYASLMRGQGNYPRVIEMQFKALRSNEENHDTLEMINILHQITDIFIQVKDFNSAFSFVERARNLLNQAHQ